MPASAQIDLIARDKTAAVFKRVMRTMQRVRERMVAVSKVARNMLIIGGGAIAIFLRNAEKQLVAEAKLAAILKTTGHAAGFSAEELKKEARALQDITKFGDEAVIELQAVLATFKQIKGDEFKKATVAILDMATIMGTDLKSNAIQVGKALNDPIKGIAALSRVGVTFTKTQIKMIKSLVETGQVAKAQAVILKELKGEFGGAAEAVSKTFGGKLKQLLNQLGDVTEEIGMVFIPDLERLIGAIKDVVPGIIEWVSRNKELILTITKWALVIGGVLVLLPKVVTAVVALIAIFKSLNAVMIASRVAMLAMVGSPVIAGLLAIGAAATIIALKIKSINDAAEDLATSLAEPSKLLNEISETRQARGGNLDERIASAEKLIKLNEELLKKQEQLSETGFKEFGEGKEFLFGKELRPKSGVFKNEQAALRRASAEDAKRTKKRLSDRKKELSELLKLKTSQKPDVQSEDTGALQKEIDDVTASLREQVEMFGESADAVMLYRLSQKGAIDEQLKELKILQETRAELKKDKIATDAATSAIKSMADEIALMTGTTREDILLIDLENLGAAKDDLATIRNLTIEKQVIVDLENLGATKEQLTEIGKLLREKREIISQEDLRGVKDEVKRMVDSLDEDLKLVDTDALVAIRKELGEILTLLDVEGKLIDEDLLTRVERRLGIIRKSFDEKVEVVDVAATKTSIEDILATLDDKSELIDPKALEVTRTELVNILSLLDEKANIIDIDSLDAVNTRVAAIRDELRGGLVLIDLDELKGVRTELLKIRDESQLIDPKAVDRFRVKLTHLGDLLSEGIELLDTAVIDDIRVELGTIRDTFDGAIELIDTDSLEAVRGQIDAINETLDRTSVIKPVREELLAIHDLLKNVSGIDVKTLDDTKTRLKEILAMLDEKRELIDEDSLVVVEDRINKIRKLLKRKQELETEKPTSQFVGLQSLFKKIQAAAIAPDRQRELVTIQKQLDVARRGVSITQKVADTSDKALTAAKQAVVLLGEISESLPGTARFGA